MAKRGMNIYKRSDGRWEGRYKNGYKADGKARYSSVYGKSYSAVKEKLEMKRSEVRDESTRRCTFNFGEILNNWRDDIKNRVKESTLANYEMKLNKHIFPRFAGVPYDKITAEDLNGFIDKKIDEKLSAKYVADIVLIVKSAAKFAQRRYGYANRIACVTVPKAHIKPTPKMLNRDDLSRLKKELLSEPTSSNVGVLLAATTGIRIGELCALKWQDIDLEKSILTVRHTAQRIMTGSGTRLITTSPKSAGSLREIPLPDFILPILKNLKANHTAYLLSGNEKITEPRTMQYRFKSLLKKAGLTYVNFHSLRHAFATSCIELGIDVKTLSEILGHNSVKITLDRYVHSSSERKKSCMKVFSDHFAA